jgi:hypothetical protein
MWTLSSISLKGRVAARMAEGPTFLSRRLAKTASLSTIAPGSSPPDEIQER